VEEDERRRRGQQRPEESVAEVGAEDRVGGDAGGVVVRKAGQDARPHDRQQSEREPTLARPDASRTYVVAVAGRAPGRWHAHKGTFEDRSEAPAALAQLQRRSALRFTGLAFLRRSTPSLPVTGVIGRSARGIRPVT
jgi:hypothetical protein